VLTCYAGLGLIEGPVPPYAAWVLIWSIATGGTDRHRSVVLTWVTAALTSALLVLAELARPGVGALAFLVVVTMLVTLAAVLVRTERGRVEAVGRRATTEERLRIARDLHDLVGHGLSAIAVQSSTARVALQAGDPVTASKALAAVEATSRVAMREMRQMLGVLVDPGVDAAGEAASAGPDTAQPDPSAQPPSPGLDDIPALVDNVRAGGVAVSLSRTGPWEAASPAVQVCAYRLVQEGLTNAVKHAPGALVTVRLEATGADWRIEVRTAGAVTASNGRSSGGRGLDGLRARVTALSGDFASGPTQHGWLLEARLPVEGAS
jgi:signal transduction histidine kinase